MPRAGARASGQYEGRDQFRAERFYNECHQSHGLAGVTAEGAVVVRNIGRGRGGSRLLGYRDAVVMMMVTAGMPVAKMQMLLSAAGS